MATIHEITAERRTDQGKGASRRLRRAGKVPAVIYGAGQAAENIQFDHLRLSLAAKNDWFSSAILDLLVDGNRQKVLLRDLQKHPVKPQLLHLDFLRIDETKPVRVYVTIRFLNKEKSPAAKTSGVVISHNITEVEVSCLPKDLPEYIEVDLSALDTAHSLHVSGVKLPAGVSAVTHRTGDPVVATAVVPKAVVETEAAPAEGEAAAAPPPTAEAKPAEAKVEEKGGKKESAKEDKKK